MSDLLAIQNNLLKASADELLRTDLLHMTTKEQNMHKEYLLNSYVCNEGCNEQSNEMMVTAEH